MVKFERVFRLANAPGSLGLSCESTGVSLAGAPLLLRTAVGFAPRPVDEIDALMKCAYGPEINAVALKRGLDVVAEALNRGDLGRAMIAAVHLRLPELSFDDAARLARADDALTKYDPDEPRDQRGRWTTGGGSGATGSAKPQRSAAPLASIPVGQRRGSAGPSRSTTSNVSPVEADATITPPNQSWGGPTHLHGGQITPVQGPGGMGGNLPPEFVVEGSPEEAGRPRANTTEGAEPASPPIGYIPGDPNYPMNDGVRWPNATHDLILQGLAGKNPRMVIFVPLHGDGPVLTGPDRDKDYPCPEGYLNVTLTGIPQVTRPVGRKSYHAYDSVDEALELAKSRQFGTIYFNRAWSTLTNGEIRSRIRPDVVGVILPGSNIEQIYHPVEVMSQGQKDKVLRGRWPQDLRINYDRPFKLFRSRYQRSPYFIYFDTPRYET